LDPQALFIVDTGKNTLIFLHIFKEDFSINQKELSLILGKIASQSAKLELNTFQQIQIEKRNFFFGSFEKLIIIFQYLKDEPPSRELLIELNESFIKLFADTLTNYSTEDIIKFKVFKNSISRIILKYPKENYQDLNEIGSKPIIDPIKREFYSEKLSIYKKDEVLWNEAKQIKDEYATKYIDGLIFKLQIFICINQTQYYKVCIDFSDYPAKPEISITNNLVQDLQRNLDELLYFYKTWDKSRPPHIIELIREFEAVLWQYNFQERLSKSSDLTSSDLPKLDPLPNIDLSEKND
jgi:hypothetical protein